MSRRGWAACVMAVTAALYANSLPGAFYFDDFGLMLDNPRVGSSFSYRFFLEHYGGRPLTLLSLHWNLQLAGRDPLWFHVVNTVLHIGAVGILFWLVESWTRNRRLALLAALVFGLHPLQTQAVNYVWARAVLLMTVFGLLSLLLARRRPWWALAMLQLAVWSRAESLVLLLPLTWITWRGVPGQRRPSLRLAWVGAAAGMLLLNLLAIGAGFLNHAPREVAWTHSDALHFWSQQPAVVAAYASMMIWPVGLSIDHGWRDWSAVGLVLISLALAMTAVGLWVWRRRRPIPAYALGFTVLLLLPSTMVPNTVFLSESRTYFAMAGFAVFAGWMLDALWRRHRQIGMVAAGVVLTACAWRTQERNRLWNHEPAIWREAVRHAPTFDRVRYNLGFALTRQGRLREAEEQFRAARNLNPADGHAYAALAYCAEIEGRTEAAERLYKQALSLNPLNRYALEGRLRIEGRSAEVR